MQTYNLFSNSLSHIRFESEMVSVPKRLVWKEEEKENKGRQYVPELTNKGDEAKHLLVNSCMKEMSGKWVDDVTNT